jgi:hypothetical protein
MVSALGYNIQQHHTKMTGYAAQEMEGKYKHSLA